MCGISGILSADNQQQAVERMVAAMHHRGPDDRGVQPIDCPVALALGNTRLAIIDLSAAGHMPMHDPESGNWIAYNGEVYNFVELRQELEAAGVVFRSGTDTEVILKAYSRWGEACVGRLRGMFAFAIWDQRRGELFLARDRVGKKPLYYHHDGQGRFLFASEVRALLASGLVAPKLEARAVACYLFNGFVVSPLTMVRDVVSLLPGYWMRVSGDGAIIEQRRYWQLPAVATSVADLDAAKEAIRSRLDEAVRLRLISDVPLGAFLSGGLDSSAIVAMMARAGGDVRTFSITFDERGFDESTYSHWVARAFNTRHTEVRLKRGDFLRWLPDALGSIDQPTFDGINTYCVSRAARESGLTVALSGTGADELFGGYPFFRPALHLAQAARLRGHLPTGATTLATNLLDRRQTNVAGVWKTLELLYDRAEREGDAVIAGYQTSQILYPSWMRRRLLSRDLEVLAAETFHGLPNAFVSFLAEESAGDSDVDQLSKLLFRLFMGERCMRDTDSMSMGVSLEVRAPFTDHLFVESVLRVPGAVRCKGAPNKPFEWDLVRPYLGEEYPIRQKQGFIFPFAEWLREADLLGPISDTLTDSSLAAAIGLRPESVADLLKAFAAPGAPIPWSRLWSLYVLFDWCRRHRVTL